MLYEVIFNKLDFAHGNVRISNYNMKNAFVIILGILFISVAGAGIFYFTEKQPREIACTMEAMICPDGTAVGRVGPKCEFAPCPQAPLEKSTAKLNERIFTNGVYITPLEVTEDSRCPIDVFCVWAGTVRLKVRLEMNNVVKEDIVVLGSVVPILEKRIKLLNVSPYPNSGNIILSKDYQFEFQVKNDS